MRRSLLTAFVFTAAVLQAGCDANGNTGPDSTHASPGQWPTYNNAYDGQRFSAATSITPKNVATLKRVCEVRLGDSGSFHSGPIVIGDTLYVTTAHTTVSL